MNGDDQLKKVEDEKAAMEVSAEEKAAEAKDAKVAALNEKQTLVNDLLEESNGAEEGTQTD